jgi:hypothetical protein
MVWFMDILDWKKHGFDAAAGSRMGLIIKSALDRVPPNKDMAETLQVVVKKEKPLW